MALGSTLLAISPFIVVLFVFILGIGWEIKDGLFSDGQGFSWKDLMVDIAGIGVGCLLFFFIN